MNRMNIAEFLLARIEEDAEAARLADGSRWLPEDKGVTFEYYSDDFHDGEAQARLTADTKANMRHIAMHGPARVIRECEVKLRIVKEVMELHGRESYHTDPYVHAVAYMWLTGFIIPMAHVYRDHPDYDEVWG